MAEVRAALADRVVQREAARVLRHMAKARLERRGPGGYVLCLKPGGRAKLVVEAAIVEAFQERGWVSPAADGRLALASEGRIWLSASRNADPHGFRGQHGEIESLPGGLRVDRMGLRELRGLLLRLEQRRGEELQLARALALRVLGLERRRHPAVPTRAGDLVAIEEDLAGSEIEQGDRLESHEGRSEEAGRM